MSAASSAIAAAAIAAAAAAGIAGCSEVAIERDVCGNGIVEPGEDCDSTDPACSACGITCVVTDDCAAYDADGGTAGFVCGPDGFCHAPSGAFEVTAEAPVSVASYRVSDTNDDGAGDVIAQSSTSVDVLFGSDGTTTPSIASILTPFATGGASFGDLDGDGSLDVLMPTADGIAAYTSPFGVPAPFPFPNVIDPAMGTPLSINRISDLEIAAVGVPAGATKLALILLDITATPPTLVGSLDDLCGAGPADVSADDLATFDVAPGHQILAFTVRPGGQQPRLCAVTIDRLDDPPSSDQRFAVAPVALPPVGALSRPELVDLRGLGCPSLVVVANQGLLELPPTASSSPCALGTPRALTAPGPAAGATPVGAVALQPALPGFGPQALALTTGLYGVVGTGTALVELHRAVRPLGAVRTANLDGNDRLDAVAIGRDTTDVEFLTRRSDVEIGFDSFFVPTGFPIASFLVGDYDGNLLDDVAFVEQRVGDERLLISFSTADRPLPGAVVGSFLHVRSVVPSNIPDSTDPFNKISDLAVLFDTSETSELALFHGSPQRAMQSFFDPRSVTQLFEGSVFRGVVSGRFGGATGNDLLAIDQAQTETRLWLSIGATGGALTNQLAATTTALRSCLGASDPTDPAFCLDGAHFVAVPSGDHDLVLGLDTRLTALVLDPTTLQDGADAGITRIADAVTAPAFSQITNAQVIALDDGRHVLAISFGPTRLAPRPREAVAVELCELDGDALACRDVAEAIAAEAGPLIGCMDVGQARVEPASRFHAPAHPGADLVIACRREAGGDAVFQVAPDLSRVTPLLALGNADALQVGDTDGDGIDDLVVVDRSLAVPLVRVFRQCNSRDLACGQRSATAEDK